jgi:hypothetical protein
MKDVLAFVWARISGPLGTFVRAALVAALAIIVGWGPDVLAKSAADWRILAGVVVAALAKVAYNALDPSYQGYGRVAPTVKAVTPRD